MCMHIYIITHICIYTSLILECIYFFARISYLEIYNETMFDLLTSLPETQDQAQLNPMTVVEDQNGCYVKGLSCHLAQNEEEALNLLFEVSFKTKYGECLILCIVVIEGLFIGKMVCFILNIAMVINNKSMKSAKLSYIPWFQFVTYHMSNHLILFNVFLVQGETNRAIAEHALNNQSSRSHCVFTVYIEVSLLSPKIPLATASKI